MSYETSSPLKVTCPARLSLADGRSLRVSLYLLNDETRPGGVTPVEELLDEPRSFLPVGLEGGAGGLVARDLICMLEIAPDAPGAPEHPGNVGSCDFVTLHLTSREEVSGILRTISPFESRRMSDIFNEPGRFVSLTVGDQVAFISKAHIVQVKF